MNKRIYISGRITGDPGYQAKFSKAENDIRHPAFREKHSPVRYVTLYNRLMPFVPVNPTRLTLLGKPLVHFPWHVAMAVCLLSLVRCRYVYMLRDWRDSRGATVEHKVAKFLHKTIIYQ